MSDETTTQKNVKGEPVGRQAKISRRSRPSIRIATDHFVLKANAKVIASTRKKGEGKMREKVKVKKEKTEDVVRIDEERRDEEIEAILEAAMHADLPAYDEDWEVIQQPTRSGGLG